jgi:hypothetical protein
MKDASSTIEGITGLVGEVHDPTAPHPAYSLDGLLALALAVLEMADADA